MLRGLMSAIFACPRISPVSLRTITAAPSRKPSEAASDAEIRTSSRTAPVSGSRARCTIELNCFPRRVDIMNRPPGSAPSGLEEHLRSQHDVLVDPAWDPSEGRSNVIWLWECFEEVPAGRPQDVDLAECCRLDLLRCAHARRVGDVEAPQGRHLGSRLL